MILSRAGRGYTKPLPGTRINWGHPLARGLVGCWLFNEGAGTRANDLASNVVGTLTNGAKFVSSQRGLAVDLDGVDDFINIANHAKLDFTSAFTVAVWIRIDAVVTYAPLVFRGAGTADDIQIYVQPSPTSDLILEVNDGNGGTFDFIGWSPPPLGRFFHLAVTFDGTNARAFYDGVAATITQGALDLAVPLATNKGWLIGKTENTVTFGAVRLLDGLVGGVSFYNRALPAFEIIRLYAEPSAFLLSQSPSARYFSTSAAPATDRPPARSRLAAWYYKR